MDQIKVEIEAAVSYQLITMLITWTFHPIENLLAKYTASNIIYISFNHFFIFDV